jgi:hypothetical protein
MGSLESVQKYPGVFFFNLIKISPQNDAAQKRV